MVISFLWKKISKKIAVRISLGISNFVANRRVS